MRIDPNMFPKLDKVLYSEFHQIASSFGDEFFYKITRPVFQAPQITEQIDTGQMMKELGNNAWLKSYKPKALMEIRLRHLAGVVEGQAKTIFSALEVFVRNKVNAPSKEPQDKLGATVNYLLGQNAALSSFGSILSKLDHFGKIHELRNGVNHNSYAIVVKYRDISSQELIDGARADVATPKARSMLSRIESLPDALQDKVMKVPAEIGRLLGLKADNDYSKIVDEQASFVLYGSSEKWAPLKKSSRSMRFPELTALLNALDDFCLTGYLAILNSSIERTGRGALVEKICRDCNSPTTFLASDTSPECHFCDSKNVA